ncbi:MAG: phosphoglycolate phosphatase [Parcubacteria group bacterium Gr01-1014_19]|nr:MAG: phosphoglycolate phosphatase [Parcubacteria group bacterium Gr01-1014_19]
MEYKLAMFDFNGTLVDDMHVLYARTSSVFHKYKLKPPSLRAFRNAAPINTAWYRSQGLPESVTEEELKETFSATEDPIWDKSKLRPDAIAVAHALRERKIITGIVSALNQPLFEKRVEQMNLQKHFDFLVGGRENKRIAFLEMLDKFRIPPQQAFYIGDTASDIVDANLAGIISIAFTGGYNTRKLLVAKRPDFVVKSLSDILKILDRRLK